MVETPVLFITFARPDYARQTWEGIKAAKPKTLYYYSNKGREEKEGEVERNEEIRAYIKEIDWDCNLHTWFRDECVNVYDSLRGAIDWLFRNEEQGIVLEEDCVPTLGFFSYADQLIAKFKDDRRVWFISGDNFINYNPGGYDYIFSHHSQIYGWASWKNRWDSIDWELKHVEEFIEGGYLRYMLPEKNQYKYMKERMINRKPWLLKTHCWDAIFFYNMLMNNGLSVYPRENLISNIGYVGDHHSSKIIGVWNTPAVFSEHDYLITNEPPLFIPDVRFDYKLYSVTWKPTSFFKKVANKIRRVSLKLSNNQ